MLIYVGTKSLDMFIHLIRITEGNLGLLVLASFEDLSLGTHIILISEFCYDTQS